MKQMSRILSVLCVLLLSFGIGSCEKTELVEDAAVSIEILSADSESVTFSIIQENAASVYYSVCKASEVPAPENSWIQQDLSALAGIKVGSLEENTEYVIAAYALNMEGVKSDEVSKTVTTTSLPMVSLEVVSCQTRSIKIKISTVNADSHGYAVVLPSEIENTEIKQEYSAKDGEYTIEGLEPNTLYSVIAQAANSAGEVSEVVLEPARTEAEAIVSVKKVETDEAFAIVYLETNKDAARYYYTLTEKGQTPEDSDYKEEEARTSVEMSLYFYELETGKEYTFWAYAQNKKGYSGEKISYDFVVEVSDNNDYKVVVTEITPFNARLEITWDETKYSGACWTVQNSLAISDPAKFDWYTALLYGQAIELSSPGEYSMSDFFYIETTAEKQRSGVKFIGKDGVEDITVWRDIPLKDIEFGESECSVNLELVANAYSSVTYRVTAQSGCTEYYFGYTTDGNDIQSYAESLIAAYPSTNFDTEITIPSLNSETTYWLIAVPVDGNRQFGEYSVLEVTTPAPAVVTDSELKVSLVEAAYTSFTYNVEFDDNTVAALYYVYPEEEYTSDDEIFALLASSSYNKITVPGDMIFNSTSSGSLGNDKVYNIWMVPLDKYGQLGKITKVSERTRKILLDGEGTVTIKLESYNEQEYGAQAVISITPEAGLSGYYFKSVDNSQIAGFSDEQLAEFMFSNPYAAPEFKTESHKLTGWDGKGEYVYDGYRLLVLPVDSQDRLCKPVVYEVVKP